MYDQRREAKLDIPSNGFGKQPDTDINTGAWKHRAGQWPGATAASMIECTCVFWWASLMSGRVDLAASPACCVWCFNVNLDLIVGGHIYH